MAWSQLQDGSWLNQDWDGTPGQDRLPPGPLYRREGHLLLEREDGSLVDLDAPGKAVSPQLASIQEQLKPEWRSDDGGAYATTPSIANVTGSGFGAMILNGKLYAPGANFAGIEPDVLAAYPHGTAQEYDNLINADAPGNGAGKGSMTEGILSAVAFAAAVTGLGSLLEPAAAATTATGEGLSAAEFAANAGAAPGTAAATTSTAAAEAAAATGTSAAATGEGLSASEFAANAGRASTSFGDILASQLTPEKLGMSALKSAGIQLLTQGKVTAGGLIGGMAAGAVGGVVGDVVGDAVGDGAAGSLVGSLASAGTQVLLNNSNTADAKAGTSAKADTGTDIVAGSGTNFVPTGFSTLVTNYMPKYQR